MKPDTSLQAACRHCQDNAPLNFDFSFAFQPIVDSRMQRIVSYEALVRGPGGEPAGGIFSRLNSDNLYRFDQACRVRAIKLAAGLKLQTNLNINFLPNAVYDPHLCIRTTLAAAKEYGFPTERIVFEVVEAEQVKDHEKLAHIIEVYSEMGFLTAIDDFGAGYAGLNLLAEYQPHIIKLDRKLISDIDHNPVKQAIVRGIVQVCDELQVELLGEGVEKREEYRWLSDAGISLFQGYYFAKPGFEALPQVEPALFAT
jgi:EAL domain-containing protein (putative c-di-GMP-specific phosphodiesterase class I)